MRLFDEFVSRARGAPRRVVLPEGEDERIMEGAVRAAEDGVAEIVMLGEPGTLAALAERRGLSLAGIRIVDPAANPQSSEHAETLYRLRCHKGMTLQQAQEAILEPLTLANVMTRCGACDGSVAGAVYATGDVVRAALQIIGKTEGFDLVSSFFIMLFDPPRDQELDVMVFADCALVVQPDAEELAQIAAMTAASASEFVGMQPRVAMLSFSTDGSADHALVHKVREATASIRARMPDLPVVGDIQLDAALIPSILERKSRTMQIDKPCNVLVFPGLEAGNIGYKLVERFGGAEAIGPVLQGLARPANDLSRGCSADDVYKIIVVTVLQAQNH